MNCLEFPKPKEKDTSLQGRIDKAKSKLDILENWCNPIFKDIRDAIILTKKKIKKLQLELENEI